LTPKLVSVCGSLVSTRRGKRRGDDGSRLAKLRIGAAATDGCDENGDENDEDGLLDGVMVGGDGVDVNPAFC